MARRGPRLAYGAVDRFPHRAARVQSAGLQRTQLPLLRFDYVAGLLRRDNDPSRRRLRHRFASDGVRTRLLQG